LPEIIIKLYGGLRTFSGEGVGSGKELEEGIRVSIEPRTEVQDILKQLGIPEENVHLTFVDKKRVALSEEIGEGMVLHVFPPMAGG